MGGSIGVIRELWWFWRCMFVIMWCVELVVTFTMTAGRGVYPKKVEYGTQYHLAKISISLTISHPTTLPCLTTPSSRSLSQPPNPQSPISFPPPPSVLLKPIKIIHRRLLLHTFPNLLNPPDRALTQPAPLQAAHSLRNLLEPTRAKNHAVLLIPRNRTMMRHPAIRQLCLLHALVRRNLVPLAQRRAQCRAVVQFRIHAADGGFVEAALAGVQVGWGFGQEAAGDGRVGVELDAEFL